MPLPSWLTGRQELSPDSGSVESAPKGKGRTDDERLASAGKLVDAGADTEATEILRELEASSDPEVVDGARNLMADIDVRSGNLHDAEAKLRQSIDYCAATGGESGGLYSILGVVLRRQGKTDEAELAYSTALDQLRELEPEWTVFTLRNIEVLYRSIGRDDEADQIEGRLPPFEPGYYEALVHALATYRDFPLSGL
jgi:tetratricopeptide (TPR) repeat protein